MSTVTGTTSTTPASTVGTGALTGALGGGTSIPASWRETCRTLPGCVLPRLTGTDLVELAGLLHATQPSRREEREGRKGQEGRHTT